MARRWLFSAQLPLAGGIRALRHFRFVTDADEPHLQTHIQRARDAVERRQRVPLCSRRFSNLEMTEVVVLTLAKACWVRPAGKEWSLLGGHQNGHGTIPKDRGKLNANGHAA
jgi:hypothetical protein